MQGALWELENTAQNMARNASSWIVKATLLLASTLTVVSGCYSPCLPAMQAPFFRRCNAQFWVRLVLPVPSLFIVIGSPIAGQMVDRWSWASC